MYHTQLYSKASKNTAETIESFFSESVRLEMYSIYDFFYILIAKYLYYVSHHYIFKISQNWLCNLQSILGSSFYS